MLSRQLRRSWRRLGAAAICLTSSTLSEVAASLLGYGQRLSLRVDAEQLLEQAIPHAVSQLTPDEARTLYWLRARGEKAS